MKLDVSKFKKVEVGDKHTILEHPSGHQIKVAHKGLSPGVQKQLDSLPMNLAKGGYAKYSQKYDPNSGSKASKPSRPSNRVHLDPSQGKAPETAVGKTSTRVPMSEYMPKQASKAYTEPDQGGTDAMLASMQRKAPPFGPLGTEEKQHYPPCINPSCKSYGRSHPNCRCYGGVSAHGGAGEAGFFAEGGEVGKEYYCDDTRAHRKDCEYYKGGKVKGFAYGDGVEQTDSEKLDQAYQEAQRGSAPIPETPAYTTPTGEPIYINARKPLDIPSEPVPLNPGMPTPSPTPVPTEQELAAENINPNQEMPEAKPAPEKPPQEQVAEPVPQQADPYLDPQQRAAHVNNMLNGEQNKFEQEVQSGNIEPQTYHDLFMTKQDGTEREPLNKIVSIFALMVGGAGAGLTGKDNMYMKMMDNEIKNNLQAQETSATNRRSIVTINADNVRKLAESGKIGAETRQIETALNIAHSSYLVFNKIAAEGEKIPPGPTRDLWLNKMAILYKTMKDQNAGIFAQAAAASAMSEVMGSGKNTMAMKSGLYGEEFKEIGEDTEAKTIPGFMGQATAPMSPTEKHELKQYALFDKQLKRYIDFIRPMSGMLKITKENYSKILQAQAMARELRNSYRDASLGTVYRPGEEPLLQQTIDANPQKFWNAYRVLPPLEALQKENMSKLNDASISYGFEGYQNVKKINGVQYKKVPGGWQKSK